MSKDNLQSNTLELFEKLKKIKLNTLGVLQTTNEQMVLADLQKKTAKLAGAIGKEPKAKLLEYHEAVAAGIDTAGLLGIISNDELDSYYKLIDNIWKYIEKEK